MSKDAQASIIREMSRHINRLDALDFDSGYAAGYDAGVKYAREQAAQELEAFPLVDSVMNPNHKILLASVQAELASVVRGKSD